jgi:hypothetical protein
LVCKNSVIYKQKKTTNMASHLSTFIKLVGISLTTL